MGRWQTMLTGLFRINLALALVIVTWLAFTNNPPEASVHIWDKASHFSAFFVLAFLADQSRFSRFRTIFIGLAGYGVFIEVGQWLLGYRYFELNDIVADLAGVASYSLISTYVNRLPIIRHLHIASTESKASN